MSKHDAKGSFLCIHSVVVKPAVKRRGVGSTMLKAYVDHLRNANKQQQQHDNISRSQVKALLLISKKDLVPFYEKCGFKLVGQSDVEHGVDQWFECRLDL